MDLKELDMAVALATGWEIEREKDGQVKRIVNGITERRLAMPEPKGYVHDPDMYFSPSTDPRRAMNLIREYGVGVMPTTPEHTTWQANFTLLKQSWSGLYSVQESVQGPPPEIAIAKAIVAMKGEE